jgi:hypothetical protein
VPVQLPLLSLLFLTLSPISNFSGLLITNHEIPHFLLLTKAKERIRELERELESLQKKLGEQEDKSNKMYLHMYAKEAEAGPSTSKVRIRRILEEFD